MKKVFIVGGTSGIGEELARYYLNQDYHVAICGRDLSKSKLEKVEKFEVDVKKQR